MSEFYGMVEGNRGIGTRCGTASSGIKSSVQSWGGSVQMCLRYNLRGELMLEVSTSNGSSFYGNTIFRGSLDQFEKMCRRSMKRRG